MKKKVLMVSMLVLALSVVAGVSIAYATVTSRLEVNGSATMNSGNWSVHFENLRKVQLVGSAKETSSPKLHSNSTGISNFDIDLYQSGDSATYTFDVVNDGGLDAYISSITIPKPVCNSKGSNAYADNKLVCDNLSYNLSYSNGNPVNINDTLVAGTKKTLKLTLKYSGKTLPSSQVEISGLEITMIYSQR